ncbi:MAG: L-2-amino-thiazoline-4-carboxylic acid hydrolase [Anaerolineae bacterium]|nr:L-2-amino-thiazoline-4-carboxylic acid hydrolase [Anaerolineae bacterium]
MEQPSYYTSQKQKLLKNLDELAVLLHSELDARHGKEKAIEIHQDTLAEYEKLIPQLPYVGGDTNPLTSNLVEAAYGLALYRALQKHGGTLEEAGELAHLGIERRLSRIPAFIRHLIGKIRYSPRYVRKMKQRAQTSQQRRYPGDWVFEVIDGDNQSFDVGIDYTECGIDKFMRSQGAEELTPYLCNTDYMLFRGLGMELIRTKTLAWGCDRCDFRIKKKGSMPPTWPPRFVERTCGQNNRER